MKKSFLFLLCIFLSLNANAICEQQDVKMNIVVEKGKVKYDHTKSRKEFEKYAKIKNPNMLGLTVSNLRLNMGGKSIIQSNGKQYCSYVSEINFYLGFDEIDVYIDKKYPKNSCNYKVIKEHEDYHVAVSQQAMVFFKPDIERELKKIVSQIKPEYTNSRSNAERIKDKQFKTIQNKIAPLLKHINRKINEKNNAIDTPESYAKTTKRCKKW
ncbi:MAG: hypothetical protein IJY58_00670 [Alphaproteobacteria bacterium]|nr:hypothetical protein [Alphaproteobacteria bacterium]